MRRGDKIRHSEYGPGTVLEIVGQEVLCAFFGERLMVQLGELDTPDESTGRGPDPGPDVVAFRRAFEAINLGVVPPDPVQMLALSIASEEIRNTIEGWLGVASAEGLCKVIFGDYGTGKTHYLRVMQAAALQQGWVVAFVEFDPKQADPAKPHLVYRSIVSSLRFPQHEDGSVVPDFVGFLNEVRRHWSRVRTKCQYLRDNPWFRVGLEALSSVPHSDDHTYLAAAGWLAGDGVPQSAVRSLVSEYGLALPRPPSMPRTKETAEIYVFHLVVLHWLFRTLGYRGLLILLDEAEHVRGFNVRRRERATNLFDWLARCARPKQNDLRPPVCNEHLEGLLPFWRQGPHFGLVVGLTEGDTFSTPGVSLRDACVFLRTEDDMRRLVPPSPEDYAQWCAGFLDRFASLFPGDCGAIRTQRERGIVVSALKEEFRRVPLSDRNLRLWTKLAAFVPALLLARAADDAHGLAALVRRTARTASGQVLPWETM